MKHTSRWLVALLSPALLHVQASRIPYLTERSVDVQEKYNHTLQARAGATSAGVGIELECRGMLFMNDNEELPMKASTADFARVKAAPFILQNRDEAQNILDTNKERFKLTAEHSADDNIRSLIPEIIVDGLNVKVGASNPSLKEIGNTISSFIVSCPTDFYG